MIAAFTRYIFIIHLSFLSLIQTIQIDQQQPSYYLTQMPSLSIQLIYPTQNKSTNTSITKSAIIYNNSTISQQFSIPISYKFSCANQQLFTLLQYSQQVNNQSIYYLVINNFNIDLYVNFVTKFNEPMLMPTAFICFYNQNYGNSCSIQIKNQCINNPKLYNVITGTISTMNGTQILQFQYNFICDQQAYSSHQPIQWGALIIVIFSIFMIFICSKFQQTRSFSNPVFFINYPIIIIVNSISIVKFVLVGKNIPNNVEEIIQIICVVLAILAGVPSIMVCFCQAVYAMKIKWLRFVFCKELIKVRIRVMDILGFAIGVGVMAAWFFNHSNYILSDIIFVCIYLVFIKTIKFGSLKIVLVTFGCSLALSIIFVGLSTITQAYVNANNFNNPIFLSAPIIAHVPNRRCSWYFIVAMAYPGMFLAFLQRFDRNKGALIYSPTFLVCYGIFSIAWFAVGSVVQIPLPYDLFTVPISMAMLLLFANRRGQLDDLWDGRFFDEQKNYYENQRQMLQHLSIQKTQGDQKQLFQNLKYGEKSQDSKSDTSKFSQIVKANTIGYNNQLKHIYSQGDQRKLEDNRISSNQAYKYTQGAFDKSRSISQQWTMKQMKQKP